MAKEVTRSWNQVRCTLYCYLKLLHSLQVIAQLCKQATGSDPCFTAWTVLYLKPNSGGGSELARLQTAFSQRTRARLLCRYGARARSPASQTRLVSNCFHFVFSTKSWALSRWEYLICSLFSSGEPFPLLTKPNAGLRAVSDREGWRLHYGESSSLWRAEFESTS